MSPLWRAMTPGDLPAVLAIADVVHPDYPEDAAIFAERLALYPAGCRVLERDGALPPMCSAIPGPRRVVRR